MNVQQSLQHVPNVKPAYLKRGVKPVLVIDVDETVIHMHQRWIDWSLAVKNVELVLDKETEMGELLEFWKQPDLYDEETPIEGVPEKVKELHKYYSIFFVSHCYDEHFRSKLNFIARYFKFDGFINTPEKFKIDCDYIIDDRDVFFNEFKSNNHKATTILLPSTIVSKGIADYEMNWDEAFEFLMKEKDKYV